MLIISNKSKKEFRDFLDDKKFEYIETIDNPNLDIRISDHPDLSIFILDEENVVIDKAVVDYYKEKISGVNFISGENVEAKYPRDSIYNIYMGSDYFIHNDQTEKNILQFMNKNIYKHYFTRRGYSRCSVVPMGDKILTSD